MDSRGNEEDEECFFDAREEVSSVSDCNSDVSDDFSCRFEQESGGLDLWIKNPDSVLSRRCKFFQSMGFSFKKTATDNYGGDVLQSEEETTPSSASDIINGSFDGKKMDLLRNESKSSVSDGGFQSDRSSVSSLTETLRDSFEDHVRMFVRNESCNSSCMTEDSSKSSSYGDFDNSSPLMNHRESYEESTKKGTKSWLKKLNALTHVLDRHNNESNDRESVESPLKRRVQSYKKQFKELTNLCISQEFSAHNGSILTMKFSSDGKYLASAGEDCVIRVWEITENDRGRRFELSESDSTSYAYFNLNNHQQIEPLKVENDKLEKTRRLLKKKSSDLTCVVLPSRVFTILETPLHEFHGHKGEILDLSWSENGLLLSCSVDDTVRLWRLGSDECLKVFSHKNFVTCVAFNPMDENYFISGSIDGKIRMWDVFHCRVIDYTDVRDIVTAVCYRPDAKGVVIGTMTGDCRFYHILDYQLQLDREINFHGKKKIPSKRITGFQFFSGDSDKLMITSADSQIRILSGDDLICKLKGSSILTTSSPTSATFTSDGKHIVSTTEDSGVHVWSYSHPNKKSSSQKPKTIRSCESFVSHNTSIAIPWPVCIDKNNTFRQFISDFDERFSLDCISHQITRGSITWPEEKLQESITINNRSKLKLLRNACQNVNSSSSHLWGQVIVTATWDGKIRAFHNYGLPSRV